MGWFRPKVRLGAWLALAALALNLAVAFGHHHFGEAHGLAAARHSGIADHTDDDHDHHGSTADRPCVTCAVLSVASIAATPPALPAQVWARVTGLDGTTAPGPRHSDRTGFEARAPPHA
jgi:hypothetical protein